MRNKTLALFPLRTSTFAAMTVVSVSARSRKGHVHAGFLSLVWIPFAISLHNPQSIDLETVNLGAVLMRCACYLCYRADGLLEE